MRCFEDLVIDNAGYDMYLQSVFFVGYNETEQKNYIFSLDATDFAKAPIKPVIYVPGLVNVCVNTFSSKNHLMFLTLQEDTPTFGNNLVTVDVQAAQVVSNVWVDPSIEMMTFDDSSNTLWAWSLPLTIPSNHQVMTTNTNHV